MYIMYTLSSSLLLLSCCCFIRSSFYQNAIIWRLQLSAIWLANSVGTWLCFRSSVPATMNAFVASTPIVIPTFHLSFCRLQLPQGAVVSPTTSSSHITISGYRRSKVHLQTMMSCGNKPECSPCGSSRAANWLNSHLAISAALSTVRFGATKSRR